MSSAWKPPFSSFSSCSSEKFRYFDTWGLIVRYIRVSVYKRNSVARLQVDTQSLLISHESFSEWRSSRRIRSDPWKTRSRGNRKLDVLTIMLFNPVTYVHIHIYIRIFLYIYIYKEQHANRAKITLPLLKIVRSGFSGKTIQMAHQSSLTFIRVPLNVIQENV